MGRKVAGIVALIAATLVLVLGGHAIGSGAAQADNQKPTGVPTVLADNQKPTDVTPVPADDQKSTGSTVVLADNQKPTAVVAD
ncbi:hypothetical protein GT045_25110 [Streptomyces sp. SID486]|uniref:hypothetical protein n=1 Tax=Streptomyces sp. SID486 TaxID=2690264 RepID=UPI001369D120|nr:hypothetical protein [Streptomyces sp. SID486]MYX98000.1 hypothetical protein [Streptomyces sp. SID486]